MKNLQKLGYVVIGSMLTVAIMGTALAATGQMTITVDPINIQVNGTTFTPKDAQGNSVPVFSYNGTTYAPLRALAEAYGLNVGYDSKNNMATVGEMKNQSTTPTPDTTLAMLTNNAQYFILDGKKYKNGHYLNFDYAVNTENNEVYIPFEFISNGPNEFPGGPIYQFLQIATKSYHSIRETSNPYISGELEGIDRIDLPGFKISAIEEWESLTVQLPTQFNIEKNDRVLSTNWTLSQTQSPVTNQDVEFI